MLIYIHNGKVCILHNFAIFTIRNARNRVGGGGQGFFQRERVSRFQMSGYFHELAWAADLKQRTVSISDSYSAKYLRLPMRKNRFQRFGLLCRSEKSVDQAVTQALLKPRVSGSHVSVAFTTPLGSSGQFSAFRGVFCFKKI